MYEVNYSPWTGDTKVFQTLFWSLQPMRIIIVYILSPSRFCIFTDMAHIWWHSCDRSYKCPFFSPLQVQIAIVYVCSPSQIYTFFVKPKCLWIFTACSSTVAYLCTLTLLGHSTVDAPGEWEVWWWFSYGHMRRSRTTALNSYLYIERAINLATVGGTMMEANQLCKLLMA